MEWHEDAARAVQRAPFFVRNLIRKRVEEYVSRAGRGTVTLGDVQACRRDFLGGGSAEPSSHARSATAQAEKPAQGLTITSLREIGEEELRAIERLTEQKAGRDHRYFTVRACGGAVGCPLTLIEVDPLVNAIAKTIEEEGVVEYLSGAIKGPVLSHYKFRAAVAGCPNSCSEPQIADFAVVARARPDVNPGLCTGCGLCRQVCREGAIEIEDDPAVDDLKCVGCGQCTERCPTGALANGRRTYSVMLGGKLGRHPRLAETVAEVDTEEEVDEWLRAALRVYTTRANGAQRLGAILERVGVDVLREEHSRRLG